MARQLYRIIHAEYLNNAWVANTYKKSELHYGEPPAINNKIVYDKTQYDKLIAEVLKVKGTPEEHDTFTDLYVKKVGLFKHRHNCLFSYTQAWVEDGSFVAGKVSIDKFDNYVILDYVEQEHLSIVTILQELPVEDLKIFLLDNKLPII